MKEHDMKSVAELRADDDDDDDGAENDFDDGVDGDDNDDGDGGDDPDEHRHTFESVFMSLLDDFNT